MCIIGVYANVIGCPVLDVDGMGRAFPELQMYLPMIYGSLPYPTCLADHKGNVVAISHCDSPKSLEGVLRLETIRMGCVLTPTKYGSCSTYLNMDTLGLTNFHFYA